MAVKPWYTRAVTQTWRRLAIGIIAGVLVFAGISLYADTEKLGDRIGEFAWNAFAIALALALVNYALRFVRWQLYLRRSRLEVPPKLSALIFLSGFALSVTPGKVGELIKSYLLKETRAIPIADSAPIVVAERVTDLIALVGVGAFGVAVYGIARSTVAVGIAVLALGMVVISWPRLADLGIRALTAPSFTRRFRDRLRKFYWGLHGLVRPWPLTWATALAAIAWLAECVGFAVIVSGFEGSSVSFPLATAIYAVTTVAGALSFVPGGLLVTEASMALLLAQSALSGDQVTAVAATILTRLATLWFAVALGLAALVTLQKLKVRPPQA